MDEISEHGNKDVRSDSKNWKLVLRELFMQLFLAVSPTFHSIDDNSKIGETYFLFLYRFSIISLVKFIHYHSEALFVLVMNFPPAGIKKESCVAADFF